MHNRALAEQIAQKSRQLGFDLIGIAPAVRPKEAAFYRQWLEKGFAGEMAYMSRHIEKREDCRLLFPPARSIIVCGMSYHPGKAISPHVPVFITGKDEKPGRATGYIAAYARGDDYHDYLKSRLFSLLDFIRQESDLPVNAKVCVDTAPLLERLHAYYAGLGWIGKHGGLIHPRYGSWFFLGEILVDLDLPYNSPQADRCGECRRCLDACPSGALLGPRLLDARRCLSYLTIEYHGTIPNALRPALGNAVFGCDRCQSVCPWNRAASPGRADAFLPRKGLLAPGLDQLAAISQEDFSRLFRNSPLKRTQLQGLLRNTAVAIGNSGDPALLPSLKSLHERADELVRPHSAWALRLLEKAS